MKYENRANMNGGATSDMSDWGKSYVASPPSSRYGEDDASSVTQRKQRRSRLDKDIQPPSSQQPPMLNPLRPSSRKSNKNVSSGIRGGGGGIDPNLLLNGGRRSVQHNPHQQYHNASFNGFDMSSYARHTYGITTQRGPSDNYSGRFPPSRNLSSYTMDYLSTRAGNGRLSASLRESKRPRSTIATTEVAGFGGAGYESGEFSTSDDGGKMNGGGRGSERETEDEEEGEYEEEDEMRDYYLQAQRAQGSRSVTTTLRQDPFVDGTEGYYFGVVRLDPKFVASIIQSIPIPPEYYTLQPIVKVAYIFYCAKYRQAYPNVREFHQHFSREFYSYTCNGDADELALWKVCKRMEDQYTARKLEESKRAYEKAERDAAEAAKLDFNQHRFDDETNHVVVSQPEEVLSYGPLKYHSGHSFAVFGHGGKIAIVLPPGAVNPITGTVSSSASQNVEELRLLTNTDEQMNKILESVQGFKGPLIPGVTPAHSVRLYIRRQIEHLRMVERKEDVKKIDVVDALLVWQLLEIMVQQQGRVTGPDIATLLSNASEELAEKSGVSGNGVNEALVKAEAKERFNKFLLGGHINEAVESAMSDGLYADAMTLIRKLHPNNQKKIDEVEKKFMSLRTIDDPFATLVSVASERLPLILTNSSFDDDNNWKQHAAIILANLNTQCARNTIYSLGLMLAKRERHSAADFCLLVVCILTDYDPFIPVIPGEGDDKARKFIGLIHSGSHLLNKVDGLAGAATFSYTDLHATDIFDYAMRMTNNCEMRLAKSVAYQSARIEYAKRLASYGGFATDSFRYCTDIARQVWNIVNLIDKTKLYELCDLAETLQYVSSAATAETEWIAQLRSVLDGIPLPSTVQEQQQYLTHPEEIQKAPEVAQVIQKPTQPRQEDLSSEARKWHDDHQAPIEISKRKEMESESTVTLKDTVVTGSSTMTSSSEESLPSPPQPPMSPPRRQPPTMPVEIASPEYMTPISSPVPPKMMAPPPMAVAPPVAPPPMVQQPPPVAPPPMMYQPPPQPQQPPKQPEIEDLWDSSPVATPSVPNLRTLAPPTQPPMQPPPSNSAPKAPAPSSSAAPKKSEAKDSMGFENRKTSKGWLAAVKERVIKSIPSANQMILPDDSAPKIFWDEAKQKWSGEVEEEVMAPPPPMMMSAPHLQNGPPADSARSSTASLRSARGGGGSRYLTPSMGITTTTSPTPDMGGMAQMMAPPPMMMALPTAGFGFMPGPVDDDSNENVDPFSGEANPSTSNDGQQES